MTRGIDIIIPIYNAYEDLCKCVESVKKHTDLSLHRLILINDCSTDERILPFLKQEEDANIIVIDNEQNAGFSNNVNKGMMYSDDRDVLLLNSDTIVTERWIEKIVACAYSKPEIGTVTPMSNSATLCSYPVFCQDNPIPENWTVDSLAKVVERCSMKVYPRITVAVGFCMFIKRETIQKVGLFDAETFERGYGEENDFCNRAEQLGYIHVMCDDTFIYHKGTVSFQSEQKKALIEAHEKIIKERYFLQTKKNATYCSENPDQFIRDNISIYTKANPNKKNLMYVVQSDFCEGAKDNTGGTQHHVRDLVANMKDDYNVYVVARDGRYLRVTMYSDNEKVSLKYYIGKKDGFPRIYDTDLANLLEDILIAFEINLLHVHHVHGLSFDIFHVAKKLNIPVMLSMHDYYYVCPNVALVNAEDKFCGGVEQSEVCETCLKKKAGIFASEGYVKIWRDACKQVFECCNLFIVPSQSAKAGYEKCYPELKDKIIVIEHGLEIEEEKAMLFEKKIVKTGAVKCCYDKFFTDETNPYAVSGWTYLLGVNAKDVKVYAQVTCGKQTDYILCVRSDRKDVAALLKDQRYLLSGFSCDIYKPEYRNKKIYVRLLMEYNGVLYTNGQKKTYIISAPKVEYKYNVAFVGGLAVEKGAKKACEMIQSDSENVQWHVFGSISEESLVKLKQENLVKHGRYRQEELPRMFQENKIDLVCIMSICSETFCYTLSEAVACNIPVLVTDIGAAGERVKRHGYGWTVPVEYTGKQMAEFLLSCLEDVKAYSEKKETVTAFKETSLQEMANAYKELYVDAVKEYVGGDLFDPELIFKGLGITKGNQNVPYQLVEIKSGEVQKVTEYRVIRLIEKVLNKIKRDRI